MKPTIGRIVHFVLPNGEHRPAMVVTTAEEKKWNGYPAEEQVCQLSVFIDGTNDYTAVGLDVTAPIDKPQMLLWRTSIKHSENKEAGTWHWPEIEK